MNWNLSYGRLLINAEKALLGVDARGYLCKGPGKRMLHCSMLHATKSHMSVLHCSIRLTAFYYIVAYQAFDFYSMLLFLVERWQKKH